jgi:hypothetical protein
MFVCKRLKSKCIKGSIFLIQISVKKTAFLTSSKTLYCINIYKSYEIRQHGCVNVIHGNLLSRKTNMHAARNDSGVYTEKGEGEGDEAVEARNCPEASTLTG